jgi:hypothetical protein
MFGTDETALYTLQESQNILARRCKPESVAEYRLSGSTYSCELDEMGDMIQLTEGRE